MASSEAMACGVCFEDFNQNDQKPKILPCGHTFCSTCLRRLAQRHKGLVPCPMCKRKQRITDVSQLITNFGILDLESVSQDKYAKGKGPAVSAGYCDEHGEHKLFRCKSCKVWICHVCTVTEHPTGKCDVISIKNALVEKKEEIRVQLQQSIEESKKMLDHLENHECELQHWCDARNQIELEQEEIQEKCEETTMKVDDAIRELRSFKDEGLSVISSFRELQDDLVGAEKPEDIDFCVQKINQISECAQEWMEGAGDMPSWKSGVGHMKNLQMLSSFTLELYRAMETLSGDQLEAVISKAREFALFSSVSVYVEVEVNSQPLSAKVSTRSMTSAVLGVLDSDIPPPEACIMQLEDLMAKFPLVYVAVKTPQKELLLPLVKDSKGYFWLRDQQDVSPPTHRRHLLIPMTTLLRSGRVWFKHWFAQRFSNLNNKYQPMYSLRSFQAQDPPEGSFIMTADVVAMLSPDISVTLILEWDGKKQGFLSIKLFGSVQRNVQFQLLCCGDNGHSYRKSRLLSVANRGRPGEMVTGGDYGGRSQLPDLPPEKFTKCPVTAGLLASKPNSAQFVIYTRDLPGATEPFGCGEVYSGLDVLEEALKVEDIRNVTLPECGCFWKFSM